MEGKEVLFFGNGNTAVLVDGQQAPELQTPWIQLFAEFLESKGHNPREFSFRSQTGHKMQMFKTAEGSWNWRVL